MPSAPRRHRYGDMLVYRGSSQPVPMMLIRRMLGAEDSFGGGWLVVRLYSGPSKALVSAMYGLWENRDQMLPEYEVVADAD